MKNEKKELTMLNGEELSSFNLPIDTSLKLVASTKKNRTLFSYYNYYKRRDLFDRYKNVALFLLILSYVFSIVSCYFSYPFLDYALSTDIKNTMWRGGGVLTFLVLLEIIKHTALSTGFKSKLTYNKAPIVSVPLVVVCGAISVYLCVNGVETSSIQEYEEPSVEAVITQYDGQILELKKQNKDIFNTNNWKGKLNESSQAGKAYATNLQLIADLTAKQSKEKEMKLNKLVSTYQVQHHKKFNVRQWVGYLVEISILVCGSFYLWFMYYSTSEHITRLEAINGGGVQNVVNSGYNGNTGTLENDSTISLSKAKARLKSHESKLKRGVGNRETNIARSNFYRSLVDSMEAQNISRVELPTFERDQWLNNEV